MTSGIPCETAAAPGPGPGDTGISGACGTTDGLLGLKCSTGGGTGGGGTCAAVPVDVAMVTTVAKPKRHFTARSFVGVAVVRFGNSGHVHGVPANDRLPTAVAPWPRP